MSLKSKAKAARKRAHNQRMAQAETQRVEAEAQRLMTLTAGFARTARPQDFKVQPKGPMRRRSLLEDIPKQQKYLISDLSAQVKVPLSEEMQERDDKAREVAKAKSGRLLPAFNKGADTYHTDEMLKDVLSGANRRRN